MDPETYFANLALAAMVDGELAPEETALLERHAENLRLSSEQAQTILNKVYSGELKGFIKPASPEARKAAFKAVVRILRADAKLTSKEQKMIRIIGKSMEISEPMIQNALSPKWDPKAF